jgi:hypothetical protein
VFLQKKYYNKSGLSACFFKYRQSSDRKENVKLKKFFKWFLILAAAGTAIGLIISYFCKGSCLQENACTEDAPDLTEDEDLDVDLKPVSDREYVSLQKNDKEDTEKELTKKESDIQKESK